MIDLKSVFETVWNIFINQGLPIIWKSFKPFEPFVICALIGFFVYGFIKLFGKRIVKFFSQISGDNKRETRRKEKCFCNTVDLFSNLKDIFSTFSKH